MTHSCKSWLVALSDECSIVKCYGRVKYWGKNGQTNFLAMSMQGYQDFVVVVELFGGLD